MLSSCASMQKGEFAQRKYYDFPRSKHSIAEKEAEHASVSSQNKIMSQNIIVHKEKQVSEPIVSVSATRKEIILEKTNTIIPEVKNHQMRESAPNEIPVVSYKKSDVLKLIRKTRHHPPFSDAGLTFLVMVIAAIIIPPLAVYIKDRPRLTTWFWVTLVLCILAVGILMVSSIVGAGPGLWLVSAIIALLVVFDII